jgi:hypothetical protein
MISQIPYPFHLSHIYRRIGIGILIFGSYCKLIFIEFILGFGSSTACLLEWKHVVVVEKQTILANFSFF